MSNRGVWMVEKMWPDGWSPTAEATLTRESGLRELGHWQTRNPDHQFRLVEWIDSERLLGIAEAYLEKYGCPSCRGDCNECTCASDKEAIRGFVRHVAEVLKIPAASAGKGEK